MDKSQDLREEFARTPDGPIENQNLIQLLAQCWDLFSGSNEERMSSDKIGRIESPRKDGNTITFKLERHGGTINGSSRAKLHTWQVDMISFRASITQRSHRQLSPAAKKYDPNNDVKSILEVILNEDTNDSRVRYSKDRKRVQVLTSEFIHANNNQTLASRKKRFKVLLTEELTKHGYSIDIQNWVTKDAKE